MLAYVVVLETPYFSQTDSAGIAHINAPEADADKIHVWHPQINDSSEQLTLAVTDTDMTLRLKSPLKPDLRRSAHGYN
jgi:hypothetical protein